MSDSFVSDEKREKKIQPSFWALIPFFVFAAFYLGLSLYAHDFYKVSMPIAFLVASGSAMCLSWRDKLENRVETYAQGMGETNIMIMCLIFILSGVFASVAKGVGAVDAAVLIARHLIPARLMLIGIFLVSCFISIAIGTSCGTIAALTPIACGLIGPTGIRPALMLGAVVGGAMFGDNLSMISDTTIAATRTQGVSMRDKFFANILVVIPAMILTLVCYFFQIKGTGSSAQTVEAVAITWHHILLILPYVLVFVLALLGMNVMFLLFTGTVLSFVLGACLKRADFWQCMDLAGKGALGMAETLIVALLAGGLLAMIRRNGGIEYILEKIKGVVASSRGCEFGVMFLVALVNLFTANNTVAIVIAGPVSKSLSDRYQCRPRRIASILDSTSCVIQGLIPYGAQILIAVGLAGAANIKISPMELIGRLYYPMALGICLILGILLNRQKRR